MKLTTPEQKQAQQRNLLKSLENNVRNTPTTSVHGVARRKSGFPIATKLSPRIPNPAIGKFKTQFKTIRTQPVLTVEQVDALLIGV